jgi:polysaccharide deacetylase 2 family uncharacterized protein YibQ
MAEKSRTKDKGGKRNTPFGMPAWVLPVVAVVSVVIGLGLGVAIDLWRRPPPVPVAHEPRRDVPPPVVRNLTVPDTSDTLPPSVLAPRPAEPSHPAQDMQPSHDTAIALPPPPPRPDAAPSEDAPEKAAEKPPEKFAPPRPLAAPAGAPVVAIVIDDVGLDRVHTDMVLALPPQVTLSLMTYADHVAALAARAHDAGHEIFAHVPMQPMSAHEDPGPHALTVTMDDRTVEATLADNLDGWRGYVGVNNHMGSRFTMDRERMGVVMGDLKERGLIWLDSRTTNKSIGPEAAQAAGVPYVTRDIFLDNVETVDAVRAQLAQLVTVAKSHGSAIAIGHPHAATIAALKEALPTLPERGVTLVPVTEILKRQQAAAHPS